MSIRTVYSETRPGPLERWMGAKPMIFYTRKSMTNPELWISFHHEVKAPLDQTQFNPLDIEELERAVKRNELLLDRKRSLKQKALLISAVFFSFFFFSDCSERLSSYPCVFWTTGISFTFLALSLFETINQLEDHIAEGERNLELLKQCQDPNQLLFRQFLQQERITSIRADELDEIKMIFALNSSN